MVYADYQASEQERELVERAFNRAGPADASALRVER
jgi:hypothetical protein